MQVERISDYFEASLQQLRPSETIPFSFYIYLQKNQRIILWRKKDELITDGFLDKYMQSGAKRIWIRNDEKAAFEAYLNPEKKSEKVPEKVETPKKEQEKNPPPAQPKTEAGKKILETIKSPVEEKKKEEIVAKEVQTVIATVGNANTVKEQRKANEEAKKVLEDILKPELASEKSVLAEIWEMTKTAPEFEHGANVAMYATLLAMAFGRIQKDLIVDLALAGLLHDIGISQVPMEIASKPWKELTAEEYKEYSHHVQSTLDLLTEYGPGVSPRVKQIIHQHHEKFDGTGYPQRLEGFRVDDISQLLAIADLLDSLSSGRWDGSERTLNETLTTLEKMEKSKTFPEFFNPEIFASVIRWVNDPRAKKSLEEAKELAKKEREVIVQSGQMKKTG